MVELSLGLTPRSNVREDAFYTGCSSWMLSKSKNCGKLPENGKGAYWPRLEYFARISMRFYCWDEPPGRVSCWVPSSWGDDITAVSGFSSPFLSGPNPSLIKARESGVSFVCQPFSACKRTKSSFVSWSHLPVGSPER